MKAFFTSVLSILASFPASSRVKLKVLALSIVTFSTCSLSTLSLKDKPVGSDTFKTGLTLGPFMIAIIPFTRKLSSGGCLNGPATKPALIQSATVLRTAVLASPAGILLLTRQDFSTFFW